MTYRNEEVIKFSENIVFVRVNAEKDTITKNKFGIAGYPTIVLAKKTGVEIDRIYGYAEGDEFIKTIDDYMHDRNTLADYLRRVEAEDAVDLYYQLGGKYVARAMYGEAESYYRKILQNDPVNKQGYADSALYSLGSMKIRTEDYGTARDLLEKLYNTYPESELADDAFFEAGISLRRAEKFEDALGVFKNFLKVYPESDLQNDAEIYVAFCNQKMGNGDEAVRLFEKFISDHPDSEDVGYAKKQIEKIKNPPEEAEKN